MKQKRFCHLTSKIILQLRIIFCITLNQIQNTQQQICEQNKITNHQTTDYQFIFANEPFEILEMDHIIVNVESKNGFKYILVVVDKFSKKSWFLPSKTLTAIETF